jgi:hypothetical protein
MGKHRLGLKEFGQYLVSVKRNYYESKHQVQRKLNKKRQNTVKNKCIDKVEKQVDRVSDM